MNQLYTIPIQNVQGETTFLDQYKGQVLLIVNVASRCGFTKQYSELEQLYRLYHEKGLTILGFPCNQFGHQEPGTLAEIQSYVSSCFHITFPLFAKIDVKGKQQAPLYAYLQSHIIKKPWIFIPWNFTKILVDAHGRVLRRYTPLTSIDKIRRAVEPLLPHSFVV